MQNVYVLCRLFKKDDESVEISHSHVGEVETELEPGSESSPVSINTTHPDDNVSDLALPEALPSMVEIQEVKHPIHIEGSNSYDVKSEQMGSVVEQPSNCTDAYENEVRRKTLIS